jgi:hypothetical protein
MAPGPPLGQWNIITNLNNGLLNVEDVDPVTGTIQFNPTDIYNISGTFEEDLHGNQQSINFSYTFKALIGGLYIPISSVSWAVSSKQSNRCSPARLDLRPRTVVCT